MAGRRWLRWWGFSCFAVVLAAGLALATRAAPPPPPAPPEDPRRPPAPGEKAEDYFKNIKAMKGTPAEQLVPAMEFMSAALGVDCDFCHMDQAPESDEKEEKMTARQMIEMMAAINRGNFEGRREVTCQTCHHGESHPAAVPPVGTVAHAPEAPPPAPAERPSVDAVLEKYARAVGGASALEKVSTRQQKGTVSGLAPEPLAVEIFSKAPNKRVSLLRTPRGESATGFDGTGGWRGGSGRPPQAMSEAESDFARLDAAFRLPTQLKQMFKDLRVARPGKIEGRDAVRVVGRNEGKPPVEFWFDAGSGLLLRLVRYAETPLGRNPTEVDYADYREADGIKIPYQWTVARPGSRYTVKIDEVRQNVPIDDAKFARAAPES